MSLFGYTSGGSPIFFTGTKAPKPRKKKNPRFKCGCGAQTTKNQLKADGGHCHGCKNPLTR